MTTDSDKCYEQSSSAGWGESARDGTFRKDIKDEVTFQVRLEDGEPQKARGKHASLSGARAHALRQERAGCDKSLCGWSPVMKEQSGARAYKAWHALVRGLDFILC